MKICFPVNEEEGLDSRVYGHFGSAPMFVVVQGDPEAPQVEVIRNGDMAHTHGHCSPIRALQGAQIDRIVVGGIGAGALNRLTAMGVVVFRAGTGTIRENLEQLRSGKLQPVDPQQTCNGHAGGNNCSHG